MFTAFAYTAFRLELQPRYGEPNETNALRRFLAGIPGIMWQLSYTPQRGVV